MFKMCRPANRIIEYPISSEYIDLDGNTWSYRAYVQMTSTYEVRDVVLMAIEVDDFHGQPILFRSIQTKGILDALREHASDLALEQVCDEDFQSEVFSDN